MSAHEDLLVLLQAIEAELRHMRLWSEQAPSAQALASQQPFCVDTLSFPEWLQFILLPRLAALIQAGGDLPAGSQIAPMGEMYFATSSHPGSGATLLGLLEAVDRQLDGSG